MTEFKSLSLEVSGAVAKIVLNRPEAANSLDIGLARELSRAALICDHHRGLKVVLITATGRMFCAGGDLKAFAGFGDETALRIKEVADELHKAISVFARMTPILVIAVNGTAAGAGFSLALAGDYVIAAESAKFTMAYTRAGLSPDGSSSYYLPRLVGMRRAQELMLTNRVLSAKEAQDWGVVTRAVPDADLENETQKVVQGLAAGSRNAQGVVKKLLLATSGNALEEQMELEGRNIAMASVSRDGQEGIRAFLAKQTPDFKDR